MPLSSTRELSILQLRQLCWTLWSWDLCAVCDDTKTCSDCSFHRLTRLTPYFRHYDQACSVARLELGLQCPGQALGADVVLSIISFLKSHPCCTRADLRQHLRNECWKSLNISGAQGDLVIDAAISIMTMIDCSAQTSSQHLLEQGLNPSPWFESTPFVEYFERTFPHTDGVAMHKIRDVYLGLSSGQMTARKLIKHAKISLRPTSDIRAHLRYDRAMNTLDIFHHAAFLKEQLRVTNGQVLTTVESFERGTLPRQLLLEVLDSIQKVLFPLDNTKSYSLLRSFVTRHTLDPDCLRFDSTEIRQEYESDLAFKYLEPRLLELYEVASNPRPQRRFEKWVERRSGARYTMMATIAGIIFAIFLGMAALAVSIFQTYITYQAWKHPNQ